MLMEVTRVGWLHRQPLRKTFHLAPDSSPPDAAETAIDIVDLAATVLVRSPNTGAPCLAIAPPPRTWWWPRSSPLAAGAAASPGRGQATASRCAPPGSSDRMVTSRADRSVARPSFPDHGAVDERRHYGPPWTLRDRLRRRRVPALTWHWENFSKRLPGRSMAPMSRPPRRGRDQLRRPVGDLDLTANTGPSRSSPGVRPRATRRWHCASSICTGRFGSCIADLGQDVAAVAQSVTDRQRPAPTKPPCSSSRRTSRANTARPAHFDYRCGPLVLGMAPIVAGGMHARPRLFQHEPLPRHRGVAATAEPA
jgi:hypothetical protein